MQINQIKKYLDLEHITVIETVKIICFPKKIDEEFLKKFDELKKQMKSNVELAIGVDADIETTKQIENN